MALQTVGGYVRDVRILLQDRIQPFRYSTKSIVRALNIILMEVRRLRPDLMSPQYLDAVPDYDWDNDLNTEPGTDNDDDDNPVWSEWVPLEQQFRQAIVLGIAGYTMKRDQEDIEDERATGHIQSFENMLTEVKSSKGKTPPKV